MNASSGVCLCALICNFSFSHRLEGPVRQKLGKEKIGSQMLWMPQEQLLKRVLYLVKFLLCHHQCFLQYISCVPGLCSSFWQVPFNIYHICLLKWYPFNYNHNMIVFFRWWCCSIVCHKSSGKHSDFKWRPKKRSPDNPECS